MLITPGSERVNLPHGCFEGSCMEGGSYKKKKMNE